MLSETGKIKFMRRLEPEISKFKFDVHYSDSMHERVKCQNFKNISKSKQFYLTSKLTSNKGISMAVVDLHGLSVYWAQCSILDYIAEMENDSKIKSITFILYRGKV